MDRAIKDWSSKCPLTEDIPAALLKKLGKSYTIYGCMLLLPASASNGPEWDNMTTNQQTLLYASIAHHLKVTHIAINKPIPPTQQDARHENILRAPINFTPVYGDFGPSTCQEPPTDDDFDAAFWVTVKQNGISQCWAPRWTMFSRGNISEKARLLTLPSVVQAVEEGTASGAGSAAVDLYAGIGYFAFSYIKAGISTVLCWDINPWSIKGMEQGAATNRWGMARFPLEEAFDNNTASQCQLLVFEESNEMAPSRIASLRDRLPPIRHINCGMLPSSRDSLQLAAAILDPRLDGWIHIHENFAVSEIEQKSKETRAELQSLLNQGRGCRVGTEIESIYRLKSYAPGVMHCVIDVHVQPTE